MLKNNFKNKIMEIDKMQTDNLRLLGKAFVEANYVTPDQRKKLFNFIDEAQDYEIVNLLSEGVAEDILESKIDLVGNFEKSLLHEVLTEIDPMLLSTSVGKGYEAVPKTVKLFFWRLAQKVTGKSPFTSYKDVEVWLNKADVPEVAQMAGKLMQGAKTGGKILGATIVVTIFFYIVAKLSKRYLTKMGKSCGGLKGKDRDICRKKFKLDMLKNQINVLKKGESLCASTKDPSVCKIKISSKVSGLENKLRKLEKKYSK